MRPAGYAGSDLPYAMASPALGRALYRISELQVFRQAQSYCSFPTCVARIVAGTSSFNSVKGVVPMSI